MKHTVVFLFGISCMALLFGGAGYSPSSEAAELSHQPVLTFDNQGPTPRSNRLIIQTSTSITDDMRDQVAAHGAVHGVIDNRNLIAVTPHGPRARARIEALDFVQSAEPDRLRWLAGVGMWDRDILDVVDVENDPPPWLDDDAREVPVTGTVTGAGVHVAVIDTGLIRNWRGFIDESKVSTTLARAFMGGGATAEDFVPVNESNTSNPTNLWERDTNSHGTAVASHVVGFQFAGFTIDGIAPDATIIPLKVFPNGEAFTWSSRIVAAIDYVTQLKADGTIGPVVINMSLGGSAPGGAELAAIEDAIAQGVIVVASAGNAGEAGMGWPGAFPEVISVGAAGFVDQFTAPSHWRSVDVPNDPDGTGPSEEQKAFVATFSSRAIPSLSDQFGVAPQELDVVAPGQFTVAPCLLAGVGGGNETFCFWSGTSFSSPLTAGVAALLLNKNSTLTQVQVENTLKLTALHMLGDDSRVVPVPIIAGEGAWDTDCAGEPCDPVGNGFVQADAALIVTPSESTGL